MGLPSGFPAAFIDGLHFLPLASYIAGSLFPPFSNPGYFSPYPEINVDGAL